MGEEPGAEVHGPVELHGLEPVLLAGSELLEGSAEPAGGEAKRNVVVAERVEVAACAGREAGQLARDLHVLLGVWPRAEDRREGVLEVLRDEREVLLV